MPYFDPATAESEERHHLGVAADIVQELAPAPSPLPSPDTYTPRAARAERLLLNWLASTRGGTLSAKGGIPGATGNKTFSSLPVVQDLVASAMGPHYQGPGSGDAFSLEVASTYPVPPIV